MRKNYLAAAATLTFFQDIGHEFYQSLIEKHRYQYIPALETR